MGTKEKGPDWWEGGHIRRGKRRDVYVIERRVGGTHFHISTRASSRAAALKHLERFEADPDNYKPSDGKVGLPMTAELILEYQAFQLKKELSREWTKEVASYLGQWADELAGKDLLKLNLHRDIKPVLAKSKSERGRTNALKGFFRWLRTEKGLLKHHQDVTLDLASPKGRAKKAISGQEKNVSLDVVKRVAAHLPPHVLDVLILQMGTGWHISEARRFALRGRIHLPKPGGVLAVLITEHKGGRTTRTPIRAQEHLDAATRIKERGKILNNTTLRTHTKRASKKEGIKPAVTLGVMRHSVSTWAIEGGARRAEVAEFFDHRSPNTTADHYINAKVPTVSVPVHTLH